MHTTKKRLGALFLAVCLLGSLVFGSVASAWADGEDLGAGDASNSLRLVMPEATEDNKELLEDLATVENVTAEVYLVANATADPSFDTYSYQLTSSFTDAEGKMQLALDSFDYETMATEAQAIVEAGGARSLGTLTLGGDPLSVLADDSALPNGIYLILPGAASSSSWSYTFNPSLVAMPTKKDLSGDGVIMTSVEDGDWIHAVEVVVKPERTQRYGSLRIEKTVDGFSGKPATFVFHITGEQPDGTTYDNYASIYYNGTETPASTVVKHIMAGTTVTVTEVYAGGRYKLSSEDGLTATIVADADESTVASVSYTNVPGTETPDGHGIENNFTYGPKEGEADPDNPSKWDWQWVATPADEASSATSK